MEKNYFSHRPTTFTAWLLVDSHSLHPPTHTPKPWPLMCFPSFF
jgi:hypothetical protein